MQKISLSTLLFLLTSLFSTPLFAALSVTVSTTDATCYGICDGTLTASVSGGSGNYTYTWSHSLGSSASVYGVCAGMYSVYVTDDQGDHGFLFASISEPSALTVTMETSGVGCYGVCDGASEATAGGGTPPYSYWWSTGSSQQEVSGLCGGQIDVSVYDDNGCVVVGSNTVSEPAQFSVTAGGIDPTSIWWCDGSVWANSTGGTGSPLFVWSGIGPGSTHFGSVCGGTYTVSGTDQNGCTDVATITLYYPFFPSVENPGGAVATRMGAANPEVTVANNQLTIDVTKWDAEEGVSATVLDLSGKVIATQIFTGTRTQIDIGQWTSGIYLVETAGAELRHTTKIVVP